MAYGNMFENNGSGTGINNAGSFKGWVSATAGKLDENGFVSFASNATADRLVINKSGDYMVSFSASFTNEGGNRTTGSIFLSNVESSLTTEREGDSSTLAVMANSMPLTIANGEYIDLRFESTSNDDLEVYNVSVTAIRISDD